MRWRFFFERVYFFFDFDVFDLVFVFGVGNLEFGGFSMREFIEFIKSIDVEVVVFDVVEFNLCYDVSNVMVFVVVKIIREVFGR